ncbi:Glyoxalase/Bleomycin resistance protein/Dihydroxybiphenyl dioxygenase [Stipitochalara longipes BDJ]|nr:Glyoxalase/Bleomycin resistance protein/Dihydroxybiphenyl dioxygenase [Stipitochalara longipes BDJ]
MASQPAAKITSLDHLVLTVSSVQATQKWYEQNLGMKAESFVSAATPDIKRHSLIFGQQKINLHQLGKEFEPKALNVRSGSADLCFLTSDDVKSVRQKLIENGVQMVDLGDEKSDGGVVERTGARGKLRSVYCRDPDGNLVEISNYV